MQLSSFLRTILKLDAASCLLMAAALVPGAALLESLLGIPSAVLSGAGLSLIPVALFILWLGLRERASAMLVLLVVFGNIGWTAASFALLAVLEAINPIGVIALVSQALAVAGFALLEWRGLRASMCASAA
jgi:hypothetical protein